MLLVFNRQALLPHAQQMMIDRTQAAGFVNNATALTDLEKAGLLKFVVLLTDEELRILPEKPEVVIAYVDNKRKEAGWSLAGAEE